MRMRIATVTLACALLAGCGGGGATAPAGAGPVSTPAPHTLTTMAFHIIGPASVHAVVIARAGTPISVPPGFQLAGPVVDGVLTYPDGSTQTTDSNGLFSPADSSYVQLHSATLQTSAVTQPSVKVSSPAGALGTTNVLSFAAPSSVPLAGVTLVPNAAKVFSGEIVVLSAVGTDTDDRITPLDGMGVKWSSAAGATIAPIAGTAQALYVAPSGAALNDIVTATVQVPGDSAVYSATTHVETIPAAQGYRISGTMTDASGAALSNASAVFLADDAPRVYPSFDFYAQGDAKGAYTRLLPPNQTFGLAVLSPGALSAVLAGTSANELQTGSAGMGGIGNLVASSTEFDDSKDDAKNAFPDPIVSVRDGWFAQELMRPYPFWADSGVLAVLAAAPTVNAPAAPVGSGLFSQWCYQWQSRSGVEVLTIIENTGTSCSSGGNEAFEITPQAASGSYAFSEYRSTSGAYPLNGTLSASANALNVASGSWQQTLSGTPAAPLGDSAAVQISLFGPASSGASIAQLAFTYGYAPSGTSATMHVDSAQLSDSAAGITLANASGAALRSMDATACAGAAAACYSGSATISRQYPGSATRTYQAQTVVSGDGSMSFTVASTNAGDASAIVLPVAAAQTRAAGSCVVCASAAGALFDLDGKTRLGSFSVSAAQGVAFNLLDTAEGEAPGQPIDALAFAL